MPWEVFVVMEQQLLRDASIEPTDEVIFKALGDANSAYRKFIKNLETQSIQVDWRYDKDGKAWKSATQMDNQPGNAKRNNGLLAFDLGWVFQGQPVHSPKIP